MQTINKSPSMIVTVNNMDSTNFTNTVTNQCPFLDRLDKVSRTFDDTTFSLKFSDPKGIFYLGKLYQGSITIEKICI